MLERDDHLMLLVRLALSSPDISPSIVQRATDAPMDLCIKLMSYIVAGNECGFTDKFLEERKIQRSNEPT